MIEIKEIRELIEAQKNKIIILIDDAGSIEFVNQSFLQLFNFQENEIIGQNILTFVTDNIFQNFRIWKTISEGLMWKGEIKSFNKNGEEVFLFAEIEPYYKRKTITGYIVLAEDITGNKKQENEIHELEKKNNIILSALPDTILLVDNNGVIKQGKIEEKSVFFVKNDIIGKNITALNLPCDFTRKLLNALRFTLKSRKIKQFNYDHVQHDKHVECRIIALNDTEAVCIVRDITKRIVAEKILKNREKSYKSMVENFPSGLIIQKNNRIFYANKTALHYIGCKTLNELRKYNILELFPEEYREKTSIRQKKALEGKEVPFMEFPIMNIKTGKYHIFETKPVLFDYYGEKICQIVMRDLTVQKKLIKETLRAEMAEKVNKELQNEMLIRIKAEEQIKQTLIEKEELIKEIHHRVKNNMQVMTSILNLQANLIKDENTRRIFEESQNRIQSMALVHENIYASKTFNKIDFEKYVSSLIQNLLRTYEKNEKNIEITKKIKNFYLPVSLAVPCGLILNEIISFSMKRFFVEISKKITIFVEANLTNNEVQIFISDNGPLPNNDFFQKNQSSLSFQLVTALVEQLNGKIDFDNKQQNKISIFFNI